LFLRIIGTREVSIEVSREDLVEICGEEMERSKEFRILIQ